LNALPHRFPSGPSLFIPLALLCLLAGCPDQRPAYPERSPALDLQNPQTIAAGRDLFFKHCVHCHGSASEGRSPRAQSYIPRPPSFTARSYKSLDPAYLYWRIGVGKTVEPYRSRGSVMPSFAPHLDEKERWQLVAYLRSRPI